MLAAATLSCGNSKDATSFSASPTSPPVLADPGSRRVAMQERPVLGIVDYYSPEWKSTPLTCAPRDDMLIQCIAATLDRDRIVLVAADSRNKYILGSVVIVRSQVIGMAGWHVDFKLTPDATKRFAVATSARTFGGDVRTRSRGAGRPPGATAPEPPRGPGYRDRISRCCSGSIGEQCLAHEDGRVVAERKSNCVRWSR
jgi:hypothetical protein